MKGCPIGNVCVFVLVFNMCVFMVGMLKVTVLKTILRCSGWVGGVYVSEGLSYLQCLRST